MGEYLPFSIRPEYFIDDIQGLIYALTQRLVEPEDAILSLGLYVNPGKNK
jgi:hypothetical protein